MVVKIGVNILKGECIGGRVHHVPIVSNRAIRLDLCLNNWATLHPSITFLCATKTYRPPNFHISRDNAS